MDPNSLSNKSTNSLAIMVQKIAKRVDNYNPGFRQDILMEAAYRLISYRQLERYNERDSNEF